MNKDAKIFVAGHNGMVGSSICRALSKRNFENLLVRSRAELDLTDQVKVESFFSSEKPDYVFLAAAKVGGIVANSTYPADFIKENLQIQTNVISSAHKNKSKRLMFLGSSCIYPKFSKQPIKEEYLLTGKLEETNEAYAISKIAGKTMCDAYRKQFDFDAFTIMPPNVYGIGDNFDPENSHVIAGLIRKIYFAKINNDKMFEAWGTGAPLREFIFSEDLGAACVDIMSLNHNRSLLNLGSSIEVSIKELAKIIAKIIGFNGEIIWDKTKPDGTPRKLMDSSIARSILNKKFTSLESGLKQTYDWFLKNVGK